MVETFESLENGDIRISDDVISIIASVAAMNVEGVVGMSGNLTDGITQIFGVKNQGKGVKTELVGKNVKIELYIIIEYGKKIIEISEKVQQAVKNELTIMTDLNVESVDIFVQGVHIESKNKNKATANN